MKVIEKAKKAKVMLMCAAPAVAGVVCPLVAHAAEGDTTTTTAIDSATNALVTSVTGMANSISGSITSVLPVAIPLVGIGLVVTLGLKQFKRVASKA